MLLVEEAKQFAAYIWMVLYAFGSNGSGQLGVGHRDDISTPARCEGLTDTSTLVRVTAGGNHTLVLYASGDIYVTGSRNMKSVERDKEETSFSKLNFTNNTGKNIKLCSATWEASTLVTVDDTIYTFGTGVKGELGHGSSVTAMHNPCTSISSDWIPENTTIVDVASGVHHTVAVLSNGDVFGWGNGRKGQLGNPSSIVWEPRKVQGLEFKVTRAVCGREFTYLVGDPDDGYHVVLGTEKWGLKAHAPPSISGWKDVGASWGSIFVLQQSNKIRSWGRNDHGQLASSEFSGIEKMAIGSEHALALTKNGILLSWGWGEHGNCGSLVDRDGDVKHSWVDIALPDGAEDTATLCIGAGCATSWLWTKAP